MAPGSRADPCSVRASPRNAASRRRIDHPHAVDVFRAGEEGGLFFVTMRYVDGHGSPGDAARASDAWNPSGPCASSARSPGRSTRPTGGGSCIGT